MSIYLLYAVCGSIGGFLGGLLGNYLNLKIFTSRVLAIITALLVMFVSIRMGIRIFL